MERKEQKDLNHNENSSSTEVQNEAKDEYYVNVDGEDVKIDVDSPEEYSCLMNCLEGYYMYGFGMDDDEEDDLTPTEGAWINAGYEHAKNIHESLNDNLGRRASHEELEADSSIQETGEIVYSGTASIERRHFESDKDYENADFDMDDSDRLEYFDQGVQKYLDEVEQWEDDKESKISLKAKEAGWGFAEGCYEEWKEVIGEDEFYNETVDEDGHPLESYLQEQTTEQAWQVKIDYCNSASSFLANIDVTLTDEELEYVESHEDSDYYDSYQDGINDFIKEKYKD